MDPKIRAEAEAAVKEGFGETAKLVKESLAQIDAHPIGHIACEMVRAKVQRRPMTTEDILNLVFGVMEKK